MLDVRSCSHFTLLGVMEMSISVYRLWYISVAMRTIIPWPIFSIPKAETSKAVSAFLWENVEASLTIVRGDPVSLMFLIGHNAGKDVSIA